MPRIKPPKIKPGDKDFMPAFELGDLGETLSDLLKVQERIFKLFACNAIGPRQFRLLDLAMNARRQTIAQRTAIEIRFGSGEANARKPILAIRERRMERPPAGTPPKRPNPPGTTMSSNGSEAPPRPPKVRVH